MDYTIHEMDTLRSANEQKLTEIQRINTQLTKALEVMNSNSNYLFYHLKKIYLDC